jgi:hypothetical protein
MTLARLRETADLSYRTAASLVGRLHPGNAMINGGVANEPPLALRLRLFPYMQSGGRFH